MTFADAANTLTYEGGLGADTLKVTGALTSSTVYGDSASATEGGKDSILATAPPALTFTAISGMTPSPSTVALSQAPFMAALAKIPFGLQMVHLPPP